MTKSNWLTFALFAAAASALRVWQNLTGFEDSGLAVRGNLPGLLLPAVLAAAAVYLAAAARKLPSQRGGNAGMEDCFAPEGTATLACAVAGAFLVLLGAAMAVMSEGGSLSLLLLAIFAAAASVSVLYVVSALRRGGAVQGVALLVPPCALIAYLVFLYRADASDPVFARIYIELLAVMALMLSTIERAAFAFRNGSPRVYRLAAAMAALLLLVAAAEGRSLAALLFFSGCALTELGFLAAARFDENEEKAA